MGIVNLHGRDDCGTSCSSNSGVTISGFNTTDVIRLKAIAGTYSAWNAWGSTSCSNSSGCTINYPSVVGWINSFQVCTNGIERTIGQPNICYPSAADALAGWNSAYPNGATITGATSYTFFLSDNNIGDNLGGMSIEYTVDMPVTNPLMFSCNT